MPMSTTSVKITPPSEDVVATFKTLADVRKHFSEAEIVELVCRQCDAARWAKDYRKRAADKRVKIEAALKAAGIDPKKL